MVIPMNRADWITERLRINEERMDILFSANYDEGWGEIEKPHKDFLEKLMILLPTNPFILDAACGTGKYFALLLRYNCKILGIDNSEGMLTQAQTKFPKIQVVKGKLQEISYKEKFDAVICMDAMENIFPEHWLIVLKNFYNATKNGGYIYFTVEVMADEELQKNYKFSISQNIPVELGEYLENGGYHYYPKLEVVREWMRQANLEIIEEYEEGCYHHFLSKKNKYTIQHSK